MIKQESVAGYRQAALAGLSTNVVFGLLRAAVLAAVLAGRGEIAGYDLATATTYGWLGQGLLAVVLLWGGTEFSDRVRSGDIVVDLGRPWDLQAALLATDLGRAGAAVGQLRHPVPAQHDRVLAARRARRDRHVGGGERVLTGLVMPLAWFPGRASVCGLDPVRRRRELARRVGVVFGQRSQLWWEMPLRQSFDLHAAIHRVPAAAFGRRLEECVQLLDLAGFLDTPVRQLSLGQRMRGRSPPPCCTPRSCWCSTNRRSAWTWPARSGSHVPGRAEHPRRRHAAAHHAPPAGRGAAVPARRGDRPRAGAGGRRAGRPARAVRRQPGAGRRADRTGAAARRAGRGGRRRGAGPGLAAAAGVRPPDLGPRS